MDLPIDVVLSENADCLFSFDLKTRRSGLGTGEPHAFDATSLSFQVLAQKFALGRFTSSVKAFDYNKCASIAM